MADFELVLTHPNGVNERFPIPPAGLCIGRGTDNDVVLSDKLVSRHHARLWKEGDALYLQDLDSRNGVEVNSQRVRRAVVNNGDLIQVGDAMLHVTVSGGSNIGQSILSVEKARAVHESILHEAGSGRIAVLYQAAQLLGTVFDLDVLVSEILGVIFGALPVRRGFVILTGKDGEPEIRATRSLETNDQGPPLSRTLISHVFEKGSSILTTDAQDDSRFDRAASIFGHQIHSAMCAPLRGRFEVVGAIYVDSGTVPRPYTNEDLGLLTAIALVVGVAVENARLYKENMDKERLAAIGQATAGLGHCIKNILTGIRGGSEFIDKAIREENLKYLKTGWNIMSRAVDRIEMLVMNMLTFSRDRKPDRSLADVSSMIRDVFDGLRARAEKAHVEFVLDNLESGRIDVDAQQIFRVIQNLALNALEACETTGGIVTAESQYDQDGCTFTISDTGPGISPEVQAKLFQAFVSSKGSSGTGLGLACSHKIVREHGGTITAESTEGRGASFSVYLPHPGTYGRSTAQFKITM